MEATADKAKEVASDNKEEEGTIVDDRPRLLVLHQAPELGDGHLDRAILPLCHKGLIVLADQDSFKPGFGDRSRNN